MTATSTGGKIAEAMATIMAEVGAIAKDKMADAGAGGKYPFRGIDDVYNVLHPVMTKHKVFVLPEVIDNKIEARETSQGKKVNSVTVTVRYHFTHADGSSLSILIVGEGMDRGDKATAKALSGALKYALFQAFMIPTNEPKDAEDDSDEAVTGSGKKNGQSNGNGDKPKPVDEKKKALYKKIGDICLEIAEGDKKQAAGVLADITEWKDKETGEIKREGFTSMRAFMERDLSISAIEVIYGTAKTAREAWRNAHGDDERVEPTFSDEDIPF